MVVEYVSLHMPQYLLRGTHVHTRRVVNNAVLDDLLQLLLRNTESGLYFVQGVHEIRSANLDILNIFK